MVTRHNHSLYYLYGRGTGTCLLLFFSRSGSNAGRHHRFLYTRRKNSDV